MLFSDAVRTDSEVKPYAESTYANLDRRAGEDYDRIRQVIQRWFSNLPPRHQDDLRPRICSAENLELHAAFLELYTHELLRVTDHSVTHHPALAHTKKTPDFLAAISGYETIVECKLITETNRAELGAEARMNEIYDKINQIESPDFFLGLEVTGTPRTPISAGALERQIKPWLATLAYDEILEITRGSFPRAEVPTLDIEHDGLCLTIDPIPKEAKRGVPGIRPIGVTSFGCEWVTSREEIRKAIEKKAVRYGRLGKPYVLVVNCAGELCDREEIACALIEREGLWPPKREPRFTRLSAVVTIDHLLPWSIPRAKAQIYHNPNAEFRYMGPLTRLPQIFVEDKVRTEEGIQPAELFGLGSNWPHEA